ncbi:hypothetical protein LTR66_003430 [Elasticomyces elasticus]|nr:hypothetical protein LTR66_003430 [Elasticomyces elasticus]
MEALLSVSFDNISSKDSTKIRKGLRQIEGLLAQLCLKSTSRAQNKRSSSVVANGQSPSKQLGQVAEDPAFKEFFRLQEGFEWNVATRLISCIERLLGMGSNGQCDLLILSTLDLVQGVLLLHPPSRTLFSREIYMNLLLDLLDAANPPRVQSQTLLVLVTALLATPQNTRAFEDIDGLLTVTSLFKSRSTSREVKMKCLEFLYFYLMPETAAASASASASAPIMAVLQRSPSKLLGAAKGAATHAGGGGGAGGDDGGEDGEKMTRTTEEKQRMLGRYLNNVDELVQDLRENAPFGAAVC